MRRVGTLIAVVVLSSGVAGCRSDGRLLPPAGSIAKQQATATIFDPYTDNELGPVVEGGRPRDFQQPLSDPDRSRLFSRWRSPF